MKNYLNYNVYLLAGGGCHEGNAKEKLAIEIEKWLNFRKLQKSNLLFILFGKNQSDWERTVKKYTDSFFLRQVMEQKISFSIASEDSEIFKKQVADADILFFSGGSEILIKEKIREKLIPQKKKIIIGVSAGTNIFSKFYFSNDRQRVESGLGILPIKTMCHFNPQKISEAASLLSTGESYPAFLIEEDNYITFIF